MAFPLLAPRSSPIILVAAILLIFEALPLKADQSDQFRMMNQGNLGVWSPAMSVYDNGFGVDYEENEEEEEESGLETARRWLYGRKATRHYISYGALSANRVPCPPRSGRSYYTRNCYEARTPVNPYTRGCSCIAHCRG